MGELQETLGCLEADAGVAAVEDTNHVVTNLQSNADELMIHSFEAHLGYLGDNISSPGGC